MTRIHISSSPAELYRHAAGEFLRLANKAVQARGVFHVALSGGSTPRELFTLLATDETFKQAMPWSQIQFWWSDERHVPPDDPESNFKMANDAMLSRAPVPPENIHRIRSEEPDAESAARAYEQELRTRFKIGATEIPTFDLVMLGMGPEGHTASLFPGTRALGETSRLVVANWVGKFYTWRITFTARLINRARTVLLLVAGTDKALPLKGALEGPVEPLQMPVQSIQPASGDLIWMLDAAAAADLDNKERVERE